MLHEASIFFSKASQSAINQIVFHTVNVFFFSFNFSESWHRDFCFNHHPRSWECGGLYNTLYGLLSGSTTSKGWKDSGYVCLSCTIWSLSMGLHCWHSPSGGSSGLPLELAQSPTITNGINDFYYSLQLHVVCVWILCTAR